MNGLPGRASRLLEGEHTIRLGVFFGALALCLLGFPLLLRSPWVDEIMLFLNYPAGFLNPLIRPLEWFSQAATPLYSVTIGQLGNLRPEIVRFISALLIAVASLLLLSRGTRSLAVVGYALFAMLLFPLPFQMISEMKHYGFEIVGSLLAIRWFIDKPAEEEIGRRDLVVLGLSALLGLSTIPVAGIVLGTHFLLEFLIKRRTTGRELLYTFAFGLFLVGYYVWVKYLMVYLTYNFPDDYGERNVMENLMAAIRGLMAVSGGTMSFLLFFVIPFGVVAWRARTDLTCRRLAVVTCAIGAGIMVASALGIYPARHARFLTWMVSFPWFYVVTILSLVPLEMKWTPWAKAKYVYLGMVVLSGFTHVWGLWGRFPQEEFSSTANNEAISQLRALPPSSVGFWAGGEPVVDYYRRFYPDLEKHTYFGRLNWRSRRNPFVISSIDYKERAEAMLEEAPSNTEFIVFSSHYDIDGLGRYHKPKWTGLHAAFEEHQCEYETTNLKNVTIYRVTCPDGTAAK